MRDVGTRNIITPLLWVAASGLALWVGGCANVAQEQPWIKVGTTTNAELLNRYGEPDLIQKVGMVISQPTGRRRANRASLVWKSPPSKQAL